MTEPLSSADRSMPIDNPQADLPGIPRGSSLHEILSSYGLTPTEAPDGLRRFRHELTCGSLRAVADVWITTEGEVSAFRIWSLRPRRPRAAAAI